MSSDLNERQQEVDEDMEEVVTMVDVLQEEQDLEEDTKAVLGASDAQNCTYNKVNIYNLEIFFQLIGYLLLMKVDKNYFIYIERT